MTMLEDMLRLAQQIDATPYACTVKMCTMVHRWLRAQISATTPTSSAVPSAWAGVEMHLNEEIPPDRMVFYDQHGEVYHVQMLSMDAVLTWNLANPR